MSGTFNPPGSPTVGQLYTFNNTTWVWNGTVWTNANTGTNFLPLSGGTMSGQINMPGATTPPAGAVVSFNADNIVSPWNKSGGDPLLAYNAYWDGTNNRYLAANPAATFGPAGGSPGGVNISVSPAGAAGAVLSGTAAFNFNANGILTLPTTPNGGIAGNTSGNSAPSGAVGEFLSSVGGVGNVPGSGQNQNAAALTLTAGDWDVWGWAWWNPSAGMSGCTGSLSMTSLTPGSFLAAINATSALGSVQLALPQIRVVLTASSTAWAILQATYSSGNVPTQAGIFARRAR
jgi:hypothetical protein